METLVLGLERSLALGVIVGLIVEIIIYVISFIASLFGLPLVFEMHIPFWLVLLLILVSISSTAIYSRQKRKIGVGVLSAVRHRPSYKVTPVESEMFGVKWNLLYGASTVIDPVFYAFCEGGPYCPDCLYEMEAEKKGVVFKQYYWKCDRCGRRYRCPAKTPYEAERMVERMLESEIRSGRLKVP